MKKLKITLVHLYRSIAHRLHILATAIEAQGGICSFLLLLGRTYRQSGINSIKPKIILLYHSGRSADDLKRHPFFQCIRQLKWGTVALYQRITQLGGISASVRHLHHIIQQDGILSLPTKWRNLKRSKERYFHRNNYTRWLQMYDTFDASKRKTVLDNIILMPRQPKISVLMPVYNPPINFLQQAIDSVINQLYPNWELCIADDASDNPAIVELLKAYQAKEPRIQVILRTSNGHISQASNDALTLATGEFIAFLDHDDLLAPHALFHMAESIIKYPMAGLIYSDEDKIDIHGNRHTPHFKPDWNPVLFLSNNYICHLSACRADLIKKVGGFRLGFEGAQDYDLILRCIQHLNAHQIIHIPKILYHWRAHSGSTALALEEKPYFVESGKRAINDYLVASGIPGTVEYTGVGYQVLYTLPSPPPLISIIILTRDKYFLLRQCIESVLNKTTYPNYEIIVIDNASTDKETLDYLNQLQKNKKIRVYQDPQPFNYSALTNNAVKYAQGSFLCLLNNDTEVISPHWLSEMCSLALQRQSGAIGASLWYPDETLQHGGILLGAGGIAAHAHRKFSRGNLGYMGRKLCRSNFSAVTAACLLIKTSIFHEVGGFNEHDLKIAFNDVDFCLRVLEAGYQNAWTPFAELYHYESASRGSEDSSEKQARFNKEVLYMQERWIKHLAWDPAYNPNLTLEYEDWSLAWPPI